jgi:hypothetical protein
MKFMILAFIKITESLLEDFGNIILKPFKPNPDIELVMVMIIFPLILNAAQVFLLI